MKQENVVDANICNSLSLKRSIGVCKYLFVCCYRCVATETHPYCTIIRSTAELFVVNTNHIEDIFATLQEGAANSSYICSQFIIFSACFYSYRECDAKGTQKLICPEVCPLITELYKDCVKSHVVNKLLHSTSIAEVRDFLLFSLSFNCSASNTYEVKGVSVSDESCQDLKFIYTLFPGKCIHAHKQVLHEYCVLSCLLARI